MARKRGFLAEIQHQGQLADKRRRQNATAAARANAAAAQNAEQARKRAAQAQVQMQRATVAEQKKAQQDAQRLHEEARQAEAEAMNAQLEQTKEEIASILPSALQIDPFVDVGQLRRVADTRPSPNRLGEAATTTDTPDCPRRACFRGAPGPDGPWRAVRREEEARRGHSCGQRGLCPAARLMGGRGCWSARRTIPSNAGLSTR